MNKLLRRIFSFFLSIISHFCGPPKRTTISSLFYRIAVPSYIHWPATWPTRHWFRGENDWNTICCIDCGTSSIPSEQTSLLWAVSSDHETFPSPRCRQAVRSGGQILGSSRLSSLQWILNPWLCGINKYSGQWCNMGERFSFVPESDGIPARL